MIIDSFRADAARQKSEALRNLATQLIEEHKDYTKKNELVSLDTIVQFDGYKPDTNLSFVVITNVQRTVLVGFFRLCISGLRASIIV